MAIVVDSRNAGTTGQGVASLTWNHVLGVGLSNGILTVEFGHAEPSGAVSTGVHWDAAGANTAMSKSVNAVNATKADGSTGFAEFYYLLNPASGTKQVKATFSPSANVVAGSASYSGVDQVTPFNAASPQSATASSTSPSLAITSATGELTISVCADNENSSADSLVPNASQTTIFAAPNSPDNTAAASDKAGAASVTMTYTGINVSAPWAMVGVSMRPAASSGFIPRLLEFPNPTLSKFSNGLRTFTNDLSLQLLHQDKFFGPAGMPPDYDWPNPLIKRPAIDLKTFLNPVEMQLIGKDQFFGAPGERVNYDQPNPQLPKYPTENKSFINAVELQLIGQDQFFGPPGMGPDYDWPNPQIARRAIDLLTFLQSQNILSTGPIPFIQYDFPNPLFRIYRDATPIPNLPNTTLFTFVFPFNLLDWPNPLIARRSIDLNAFVEFPNILSTGSIPFIQYDFPNPLYRIYRDATPVPNLQTSTLFVVVYPFNQDDWPNPQIAGRVVDLRTWLQSTVQLQPFGQQPFNLDDWPNPGFIRYKDATVNLNSVILIPIVFPFNQDDWPNPKGYIYPADLRTFLNAVELQLIGKDKFFGAPGQPPANLDWPVPKGYIYPTDLRTFLNQVELQLIGQDTFFGGPGQAPANLDWPVPKGYIYPTANRTHTQRRVDLFGKDTFFGAAGEGPRYDYPNPLFRPFPVATRSHIEALKQLILHKDKFFGAPGQPPANLDWPNPLRYIPANELKTLLINLQESTLSIPPRVFQIAMITNESYLMTGVNGDSFVVTMAGNDQVLITKVDGSTVINTDLTGDSSSNTDVDDDTDLESE